MPLLYPDNPKREERVYQLGTDAQDYLQEATASYGHFRELLDEVNPRIKKLYVDAGLPAPSYTSVDIMKEAGLADHSTDDTIVDVAEVIADIGGFIGTVKYLAPAATRVLVKTGAMSAETAEKVLVDFTVPVFGREVSITAGDVAGNILGGVVGGVLITGIDLGIEAIEGAEVKSKLDKAIEGLYPMRTAVRVSQRKSGTLNDALTSIKTTLDALEGSGVPLTDALITNIIKKDVNPSIAAEQAITVQSVNSELQAFDASRGSYTKDDPS